jgi:type I restriction enzyme S subunit
MTDVKNLITDNIDVWTSAIKKKSATGRGSSKKIELTGIKKLRGLILELAIRGKLVPQNPNDEPASALLEKIADEKAQLIKDKVIKKTKALPEITDEEKQFELPDSWLWCRFGSLAQHNSGKTLDKGRNTGTPRSYLTTSNLYWGRFSLENVKEMLIEDEQLDKCTAIKGDLLICEGGEAGRAAVWNSSDNVCFQNHIHRARFYGEIDAYYMYRYFEYLTATSVIDNYRKGVGISNMSGKSLASIITVLPPLAEQHRIVAKVDELMALCDQLEQQTEQSLSAHQVLVTELLATLTASPVASDLSTITAKSASASSSSIDNLKTESLSTFTSSTVSSKESSFQQNWQRISEHFDLLFTTEDSIEQLKQTILQLAVMGKLVPQNPSDEPASALLEKIAEEKAQLIADKKIKRQKPLPEITDEEKPFELPTGWKWATLSHVGIFTGGKTPSKANSLYWNGDIPWVTPKDMKVEQIFDSEDHVTKLAITDGLAEIAPESLLFVARSGILRRKFPVAITKSVCTVNQDLKVLSLIDKSIVNYVLLMMKGFEMYILENLTKIGTTVESLRFDDFSKHYFIMPPLSEQHRIVAKVDELMAICDQLKARLTDVQTTQVHLADAVVECALNK